MLELMKKEEVDCHSPVVPIGYGEARLMVYNGENHWYADFWSMCLERMRITSIPALLPEGGKTM